MSIVGQGALLRLQPVAISRALCSSSHACRVQTTALHHPASLPTAKLVTLLSSRRSMSVTRGTADKVVTSIEDLGSKRCLACEGGEVDPLTEDQISHLASLVPGWEVGTTEKGEKCITHKWRVRNFLAGLELFKRVATVAESEGHHPDLHLVSYNQVTAQLTTHAAGGLTENDFIMAAKIDKVDLSDVLSRRKAKTAA